MKRTLRTAGVAAAALAAVMVAPTFAGRAGALPPQPPPGVFLNPPVNIQADLNTDTACYNIFMRNPIPNLAVPNQPVIGTEAFSNRGEVFCPEYF